jgi:hypothetical protein
LSGKIGIVKIFAQMAAFWGVSTLGASAQVLPRMQTLQPITKPVWAIVPDGESLAEYFPDRAQRMLVGGRAKIRCVAAEDGTLRNCEVLDEFPRGFGFGAATLHVAPLFRLRATDQDGLSVFGRQVVIPIQWKMPQPDPGAYSTFLTPSQHVITWVAAPSKSQMDAVYPLNAKGLGIVNLRCVTTLSGALTGCAVAFESPAGHDFAAAGLKLVSLFRAGARWDGAPLAGSAVEVPLYFYPPTDAQWGDGAAQSH